jgi:hypothetical protein
MPEKDAGCVQPSRGPIVSDEEAAHASATMSPSEEVRTMNVRVGAPAPDFEAAAFVDGGFQNIRLSDYRGHWVALCFYPGDFTFV